MWKRIALLGSIAALTAGNPTTSAAQGWDGWGGGRTVVTVSTFPAPFFRRPIGCCFRPIPRPCCCCNRPFFPRAFFRPPYFYGDRFAPWAYNWNAGYDYDGW